MSDDTPGTSTPTLEELQANLDQLTDVVELLISKVEGLYAPTSQAATPAAPASPARVASWAQQATTQDWNDLVEWVDWLVTTYEAMHLTGNLPRCWPAHGGLVEELAALRSGWIAARSVVLEGPSDAMSVWHDRSLWPFIARLTHYQTAKCRQGTHESPAARRGTDREHIVVQPTGEVAPPAATN